jgi:quercetin dioxygenase-like cupin family protein
MTTSAGEQLDGLRVVRAGGGRVFQRPGTEIREFVGAASTGARWALGEVVAEPDEGLSTHVHPDQPEAIVILEGPVELHGERGTTILEAGDVVFMPPSTEHGLRTPSGGRWLAVWPPSLDGLFEELESNRDPAAAARLLAQHGMVPGRRYRRGGEEQ